MTKNLILLGPPGSGKGTQINKLREYLKVEVISSGDIIRKLAKNKPFYEEIMKKGELVADEVLFKEIAKIIKNIDHESSLVFDGFPRNINQAQELEKMLEEHQRVLDKVIYIMLDEEEVVKRLTIRRICCNCGQPMFNLKVCPKCGGQPIIREDDNEKTIRKRMLVFLDQTLPLAQFYKSEKKLLEINGKQSIEEVAGDIKGALARV